MLKLLGKTVESMVDGARGVGDIGQYVIHQQEHSTVPEQEHVQTRARRMDDHTVVGVLPK